MTNNTPLELVTYTESARRLGVCSLTLKRRAEKAGIEPDAILIEGSHRVHSPVFVASRLTQLKRILFPELT